VLSTRRKHCPIFYRRFLQLKAEAPEVSDDQVIVQAIKCCMPDHCTVTWLGNGQRQLQTCTRILQNLASQRSSTFGSLSNREKLPSMTKPHDQHVRMKTYRTTTNQIMLTTPIQTVVDLWRVGTKILVHLHRRERTEPSITGQIIMSKEGACQVGDAATTKAHSSLCIVCTTKMT
jgi:hypothetical protein